MPDICFLTGGTGFLGANLARLLVEKGYKVRALARKSSDRRNLDGLPLEIVEGDITDPASYAKALHGARYAFHIAADYRIWVKDPAAMYKANVQGTIDVLSAAGKAGCEKIVHCSSVAAIKPPDGLTPTDETSVYASVDGVIGHYKKSKYLADLQASKLAAAGLPIVIVNPAAPIGPYDIKPTPTGKIVVDFMNGRIPSYIDTGFNVVHVQDAAWGHMLAAFKGRAGERYILGGENMTFKQVLDILAEETGLPGPKFKTPYAVAYAFGALDTARASLFGGEPLAPLDAVRMAKHYMWFDSTKAEAELGYEPRPAREALRDAVKWFVENGYAKLPAGAAA